MMLFACRKDKTISPDTGRREGFLYVVPRMGLTDQDVGEAFKEHFALLERKCGKGFVGIAADFGP
eukprot:7897310-Karenia_brevis.AAC.1